MEWYEKIGKELEGRIPALEIVEFPTADTPDTILFQGIWQTENGEFLLEYEGYCNENKIHWLRISEWSNGCEKIAELTDMTEFAGCYPDCLNELYCFASEKQI